MENIERTNTVYYELYCRPLGTIRIPEPQGWQDDVQSLDRDKDSKAILRSIDIDLQFYDDSADFLVTVFTSFGISERVLITKYEKRINTLDEGWIVRYVQEIDMKTFKHDEQINKVTVKANEGGLYHDIKEREDDEYDLLTNESADGKDIGSLQTVAFQPIVREIFIESLLEAEFANYRINSSDYKESFSSTIRTIPAFMVYNSDPEDVYEPFFTESFYNERNHPEFAFTGNVQEEFQGNAIIYRSTIDKNYTVKANIDFTIDRVDADKSDTEGFRFLEIITQIDSEGRDSIKSFTIIQDFGNPVGQTGNSYSIAIDKEYNLLQGESVAYVFNARGNLGDFLGISAGHVDLYLSGKTKISVVDTTTYDVSVGKAVKIIDLLNRIIAKITGVPNIVRSSIFEEGGKYAGKIIDNGFWARGFPDEYENEDGELQRIQFKTSWKDAMESLEYLEPMAWFTEVEGTKHIVRVEPAKYTQQNFIGIDIGEVDDIETEASKSDFFGTIELGHRGDMEYEDINGLDEFNGLSMFNTNLKNKEGKYSVKSKYRFDSIRYELTRRKNFKQFAKEDTEGDEYIWIHDCKLINQGINFPFFPGLSLDLYTHKTWQDLGYDEPPKGIYSPDTAWNLDFSPMNRLYYYHGYAITRGLYHRPDEAVRFSSSNANQNLITIKGGVVLEESGAIRIGDFEKNRVKAELVEVTFKMTQELEDKFLGYKKINEKLVPNYFGLIQYSKNGQKGYGRLTKLNNSGTAKLKLIKAGI